MAWRWFYSTEESDTALKAILDASKFSKEYTRNENGLTDGVIEYKVWIEQDSEFLLLSGKIDAAKIRALSSPERVAQFGNIRPDNYFDTTKYAAGCALRDTDTLANMIQYLAEFPSGTLIAQRDLDIQGSASLGTVALVYSSLYKKTYNIPVNGSVSDRTLVKFLKDATAPSVVQTNATCNQAMFDFQDPAKYPYVSVTSSGVAWEIGSLSEWLEKLIDKKVSITSTSRFYSTNGWIKFDYGSSASRSYAMFLYILYISGSGSVILSTSVDGITYTDRNTYSSSASGNIVFSGTQTFRYLRLLTTTTNHRPYSRELFVF